VRGNDKTAGCDTVRNRLLRSTSRQCDAVGAASAALGFWFSITFSHAGDMLRLIRRPPRRTGRGLLRRWRVTGASDGLEGDSFRVRKAQSKTAVKTLKRQDSAKLLDFAGQVSRT